MTIHSHRHMSEREALVELGAVVGRNEAEIRRVAEEYAAKWTDEKRKAAVQSGDALPGGKFPIRDQEDMDNANTLKGSSSLPKSTVVAHMKKQAKKHSLKLPPSLQSNSTS